MPHKTSFKGVAVTGGASGIGLSTARLLHETGWTVFLLDHNAQAIESACRELGLALGRGITCDVTDETSVEAAIAHCCQNSDLSAVVNAAGIALDKPVASTTAAEFRRIVDVNLTGTFLVSRAAVRYWLEHKQGGNIVNVTSVSGICGSKGRSAYGSSKGGQNMLTLVMATELGANGIRVNAIAPGPIATAMSESLHRESDRRQWTSRVPQGRYGKPEEVAGAIGFLISDAASYITGHILAVDGGFSNAGLMSAGSA